MDVASTSGRSSLSLTEALYSQRISSLFSRCKSFKLARLLKYEQAAATVHEHCHGQGWLQRRCSSNRQRSPCSPPTSILRHVSMRPQGPHVTAVAIPPAAATAPKRSRNCRPRRCLLATAAATLDSLSDISGAASQHHHLPANDDLLGHMAGADGVNGIATPHPLYHAVLGEDAVALQRLRPAPQLMAAAVPPSALRLQPPQAPRLSLVARAALNRQIEECADWLALEALYRSLRSPSAVAAAVPGSGSSTTASTPPAASSPLGGPQLVAMARHLARLPRHRSYAKFEDERLQLFAAELAAATMPYFGEMAQGEYCALLWAYGKVDCHPGQEFLDAILPRLQPLLRMAGPTGLSQALWGLARIGHVPPEPFLCDFYAAATRALRKPSANPQHVSNLLWACVMLRLQPGEELISRALEVLDEKMQDAAPQALAITAWAMVQVGERPPPEAWWRRVQQAALRLRGKLQPQDISHLVWATARSGHAAPRPWLMTMCSEAHGCMRGFRSQELCNMLWGLVVVGFKPPEPWLTSTISAAQKLLPTFKAFEMAVLLWCLASLQAKPLLPSSFASALFFHSGPKLGFFSAQDCANVIWSLARLQLWPPEPWMAAFVEESFTQLPRFTPQHLANTLWGFARLSRSPPEPWMDRFFLESRPLLLSFKTSELAMLAMALGIARMDPPRQWLNQMLVASYSKLEHCRGQELSNLVWGLWRLSFKPPQRWLDAVAATASRLTARGDMSATDLVTLARAFSTFGAELPADVRQALEASDEAQLLLQQVHRPGGKRRHSWRHLALGVQQTPESGQQQQEQQQQQQEQQLDIKSRTFKGQERRSAQVRLRRQPRIQPFSPITGTGTLQRASAEGERADSVPGSAAAPPQQQPAVATAQLSTTEETEVVETSPSESSVASPTADAVGAQRATAIGTMTSRPRSRRFIDPLFPQRVQEDQQQGLSEPTYTETTQRSKRTCVMEGNLATSSSSFRPPSPLKDRARQFTSPSAAEGDVMMLRGAEAPEAALASERRPASDGADPATTSITSSRASLSAHEVLDVASGESQIALRGEAIAAGASLVGQGSAEVDSLSSCFVLGSGIGVDAGPAAAKDKIQAPELASELQEVFKLTGGGAPLLLQAPRLHQYQHQQQSEAGRDHTVMSSMSMEAIAVAVAAESRRREKRRRDRQAKRQPTARGGGGGALTVSSGSGKDAVTAADMSHNVIDAVSFGSGVLSKMNTEYRLDRLLSPQQQPQSPTPPSELPSATAPLGLSNSSGCDVDASTTAASRPLSSQTAAHVPWTAAAEVAVVASEGDSAVVFVANVAADDGVQRETHGTMGSCGAGPRPALMEQIVDGPRSGSAYGLALLEGAAVEVALSERSQEGSGPGYEPPTPLLRSAGAARAAARRRARQRTLQ